ncbi:MAG: cytidine deaminase [Planctomycetota bacterium]
MAVPAAALERLVAAAQAAAARAHAPASHFRVGAALLLADGDVVSGCNVENASYGLTICAERNAVARSVVQGGRREVTAVVVHTACDPPGYPCGACLQVLAEFAPDDGGDIDVVLVNPAGKMVHTTLRALMPHPFRFDHDA